MSQRPAARLVEVVVAGAVAGVLAGLVFAVLHAIIIVPIWDRMMGGLAFGAIAGAVGAWAYHELYPAAEPTFGNAALRGAVFGVLLWLAVAPATLADAILRAAGVLPRLELLGVVIALVITIGIGALWGWRRTRRQRGAAAVATATLALLIAMAGPVPIGRSIWAFGIFLAVLPASIIAGIVVGVANLVAARRVRGTLMAPQ
jgi:hypothetical protein